MKKANDETSFFSIREMKLNQLAYAIRQEKKRIVGLQKHLSSTKYAEVHDGLKEQLKKAYAKRIELSNQYRIMHIAYCELGGISREKIEKNTPRAKSLEENLITEYKNNISLIISL